MKRKPLWLPLFFQIVQGDVQCSHGHLDLRDGVTKGGNEQNQAHTECARRRCHPAEKQEQHADDAEEQTRDTQTLHVADEENPSAEICQLVNDVLVLRGPVALVQFANQSGKSLEAVGLGQEKKRDGRE